MMRICFFLAACAMAAEWNMFRGPNGAGVDDTAEVPTHFSANRNLVWKTPLSAGLSSPVISGNRIFVTAAEGGSLLTIALDRSDGRVLWQREVPRARTEKLHKLNHAAAPSVAVSGDRVFSFFGDFGLVCYTAEGKEIWRAALGPFNNSYGMGASPILAGGKVILAVDQSSGSYIAAFDQRNGEQLWKTARPEALSGASTPILYGDSVVILPGSFRMDAYDVQSGKSMWHADGLPSEMKSTPVIDGGMLFIHGFNMPENDAGHIVAVPSFEETLKSNDKNGDGKLDKSESPNKTVASLFGMFDQNGDGFLDAEEWSLYARSMQAENALLAYKLSNRGPELAWKFHRSIPQLPSPLVYRGVVYMINESGVLTTLDAKTGMLHRQSRLRGVSDRYYASPVAAAGKIYIASHTGVVSVLDASPMPEAIAANELDEEILATPAIAAGRIYIRTRTAMYCFGTVAK